MQEITDIELLIVRHLKRNNPSDAILKRLVGKYYAFHPEHITKSQIFNCLFDIVEKFDLLPPNMKGRYFFIYPQSFWEPEFSDNWDAWIYRAKNLITYSLVKKFPRYPEPAYFRNRDK